MPVSVADCAKELGARLIRAGRDYTWTQADGGRWTWHGRDVELPDLRVPSLRGAMQLQNAAGALALVEALGLEQLLAREKVDRALARPRLTGRMQTIEQDQEWLFDVAHNPAAAKVLASTLRQCDARASVAIVGILDDKDVEGIVGPLAAQVDDWIAVTAASPRAIDAAELARRVANETGKACLIADSFETALENAAAFSAPGSRVLVTGSFYTVGPLLERLSARD
jgi:dihydrofolate synthase/folylpolyglutamate synthase